MKYIQKLVAVMFMLGSTSSQALTIGAAAEGGLFGANADGGIGANYAYVEGTDITDGSLPAQYSYSYRAEATFNLGALTPVLRAEAYADDLTPMSDPNISGEAYGLQTYRNNSLFTQTYTLG